MDNIIHFDDAKFKKTSKRLHKLLHSEPARDLSLSKVQELLAQSLGFRNLFEWQQRASGATSSPTGSSTIFRNPAYVAGLIHLMMEDVYSQADHMWSTFAKQLVDIAVPILFFQKGPMTTEQLCKVMSLDYLIQLLNHPTAYALPEEIANKIRAYVMMLPLCSYQDGQYRTEKSTQEQHSYRTAFLFTSLQTLQKLETHDCILSESHWYHELALSERFKHLDLDQTWLNHSDSFVDWLANQHLVHGVKTIRVSDLMDYTNKLFSEHHRQKMMRMLKLVLKNYERTIEVSNHLINIDKASSLD